MLKWPGTEGRQPTQRIVAILLASAALVLAAMWLVLQAPWLGLQLQPGADGLRITGLQGPAAALPEQAVGARLQALGVPGGPLHPLQAQDVVEDPDMLPTHTAIRDLYARQGSILDVLAAPRVVLAWQAEDGAVRQAEVAPEKRPLPDLPGVFWLQLAVAVVALVTAGWVRQLRPRADSTAWFMVMGIALALASWSSAIYGSRELALAPGVFRLLSAVNGLSVFAFGIALIALFLRFPKPLCGMRRLRWVPVALLPFAAGDTFQWIDSLDLSRRLPMAAMLLAAAAAAAWQWRAARDDPGARATLRWFAIAVLGGCALFIGLVTVPLLFGTEAVLSQGHAFGFFLLIHVGLALGVARSQLFDIDALSARVLLWAVAGALLLLLDGALLLLLRAGPNLSLATSALVVAAAWQPLRSWLMARLVARQRLPEHEVLQGVLEVTLAASTAERQARWQALLQRLFQPLRVEPLAEAPRQVELQRDGLALAVPAPPDLLPLRLALPWRGRAAFNASDVRTMDRLLALLRQAEDHRVAYERGAREASLRIAQDLHDDVGGRLLGVLHDGDPERARTTVRTVIADMRNIVGALSGRAPTWEEAVAEWRSEAGQRLGAVGIRLGWPLADVPLLRLSAEQYRHLSSILRELVTNVVKHAQARTVQVEAGHDGRRLWLAFRDDGVGLPERPAGGGRGLLHIERRAQALGAHLTRLPGPGTALRLDLALGTEGDGSASGLAARAP